MGTFSGVYADTGYSSRYSDYSSSRGYGSSSARTNPTTATRSKINQTVKDIAQGYSSDLATVEYYLQTGDIDSAIALKESVYEDISKTMSTEYNFNVTDKQVESILDQAYSSVNSQSTLQTIEENTDNSFVTGLKEGIPVIGWFFTNNNSKAEAVAKLTGTEVPPKEKAAEVLGATASGAAIGAAIGTAVPVVGTAVGAIVGGAAGAIKTLFFS